MPSDDATWKEMMAVYFARGLRDGERLVSGNHTEISYAAAMLAQRSHAPNLKIQFGGTGWLCNLVGRDVWGVPRTSTEYRILDWAEAYVDHHEMFLFYGAAGGGRDYYEHPERYADSNRWFFADQFFVGGLQVDRRGNVNLIGIGEGTDFTIRGPGTVGICDIVSVRDVTIFMTAHDPKRFVEEVDYVSTMGPAGWRENGFQGNGPQRIVSPRGVFDFTGPEETARLRGVFPGHTEAEISEQTGFAVERSEHFEEIAPPTEDELIRLRAIDREGVLRA
jgi:glutaconate CoA-transferase subunit B